MIERWREREKERKIVILFSVILYFCFRFHDSFVARWLFLSLSLSVIASLEVLVPLLSLFAKHSIPGAFDFFMCVWGGRRPPLIFVSLRVFFFLFLSLAAPFLLYRSFSLSKKKQGVQSMLPSFHQTIGGTEETRRRRRRQCKRGLFFFSCQTTSLGARAQTSTPAPSGPTCRPWPATSSPRRPRRPRRRPAPLLQQPGPSRGKEGWERKKKKRGCLFSASVAAAALKSSLPPPSPLRSRRFRSTTAPRACPESRR